MPSSSSKMINSVLPRVQPQLSAGLDLQLFNTTPHVCIEIDARWFKIFFILNRSRRFKSKVLQLILKARNVSISSNLSRRSKIDLAKVSIPVYRIIYIITFVDQLCCVNVHKRSRYSIRKKGASFSKANCFLIFRCKLDKQIVTCMVVEHRYNRPSSTLITSEKKNKIKTLLRLTHIL